MLDGRNLISVKVVPPYRNCAFSLSLSTACCANEQQIFAKRTSWSTSSGSICNLLRICVFLHPWTLTWNLKRSVVEKEMNRTWSKTTIIFRRNQPPFKFRRGKPIFQDPKLEVAVGRLPYQPLTECLGLTALVAMPRLLLVHPRLGVTKVGPQKSLVRCRGPITPFWVFP